MSAKNFAKQNSFQESKDFRVSSTGNSRMKRLVAILAGLPLYALLAFYLYVIGWRADLGYWPRYGRPDAGTLHGRVLVPDVAVGILLAAGVLSCLIFLPAALASLLPGRFLWLRVPVIFLALAWGSIPAVAVSQSRRLPRLVSRLTSCRRRNEGFLSHRPMWCGSGVTCGASRRS